MLHSGQSLGSFLDMSCIYNVFVLKLNPKYFSNIAQWIERAS